MEFHQLVEFGRKLVIRPGVGDVEPEITTILRNGKETTLREAVEIFGNGLFRDLSIETLLKCLKRRLESNGRGRLLQLQTRAQRRAEQHTTLENSQALNIVDLRVIQLIVLHALFRVCRGFAIGRVIGLRQEEVIPKQIRRHPLPIRRRIVVNEVAEASLLLLGLFVLHESEDRPIRRNEVTRYLRDERNGHRMDRVHGFKFRRQRINIRKKFTDTRLDGIRKELLALSPVILASGTNFDGLADQQIGCLVAQRNCNLVETRIDLLEELRIKTRRHRRVFVDDVEDVKRDLLRKLRELLKKLHIIALTDVVRELVPDDEDSCLLKLGIGDKDILNPRKESLFVR